MKRFIYPLLALMLTVGTCMTLAAMPKEKNMVKIESVNQWGAYMAFTQVLDLKYIAEPSGEVISEFRPPTVIAHPIDYYANSILKPPLAPIKANLLPDIRRLSCSSVVAASNRHI